MAIIAQAKFNNKVDPAPGYTVLNSSVSNGRIVEDAGRATVVSGTANPPLIQWDETVGTEGSRKLSFVSTDWARVNLLPVLVDKDNYIKVYATGAEIGCVKCVGGVETPIASIPGVTINNGDKISAETVLEGQLTRHILINVYVNDSYANYFIIDRDPVLVNGGAGFLFENQAESCLDDMLLEQ